MFWFFILAIIVIIVLSSRGKTAPPPANSVNQQWMDYIAAYKQDAKTKAEKALLARMLADLEAQGMPSPSPSLLEAAEVIDTEEFERHRYKMENSLATPQAAAVSELAAITEAVPDWQSSGNVSDRTQQPSSLDNTTLLLYFGAFLFLASAGLFVALSGAYGSVRVATVLIVMSALYFGGLWLHDNKPKLQAAGNTFIGMGLMLAPLAGLATYSYVMRDQPELVWLLTSLLCLGLYGHALRKLKTPLMEYIFIGTFVSLFESAVSVLRLPMYFYGWGFAAVGLCMQAWSLYRKKVDDYDEPTTLSGSLLLPTSILTALYVWPRYGVVQLGVSLLLAAFYYGLQAWKAQRDDVKVNNAVVSHVSLLLSLACFAYGAQHKLTDVTVLLLVLGALQLGVLLTRASSSLMQVFANIAFLSLVVAAFLGWERPWYTVVATLASVIFGLTLWVRQYRPDMYGAAIGVAVTLPFSIGLRAVENKWHAWGLAVATGAVAFLQLVIFVATRRKALDTQEWRTNWRAALVLTLTLASFIAIFAGSMSVLVAGLLSAVVAYAIYRYDDVAEWLQTSSLFVALPAVFAVSKPSVWLAGLAVGCTWNLVLVFANRLETARWVGSFLWLLLPIGFARVFPVLQTSEWYAGSFLLCMVGMVVARAVAMKRIARLPIALSELERKLHSDSQSYVLGYVVASAVSFGAAWVGPRFAPAIVGLLQATIWMYIARNVERRPDIMTILPLLLQAALWGTYNQDEVGWYVFLSTMIALMGYLVGWLQSADKQSTAYARQFQLASLVMLYIAPAATFALGTHWTMPLGLAVAGCATLHATWNREQSDREWAGGVIVISLMWLLWYNGIENIQVYTHIFAVLFGLYAYWRATRGDAATSQSYLVAMLCAATIPLGLQVTGGNAGGLYGWWFLGEQIAIMLLGMAIHNRFVTRWGMYVAVGAVLYQLRSLAWLSLTLLAIFLIGLAVYQLQKSDAKK